MPGGESKASRFEVFFRACPDLLAIVAPDGRIEQVNEAWTALLGWAEGELVGRPLADLAADEDRAAIDGVFAALTPDRAASWQARFRARDGSIRWLAVECRRAAEEELIALSARGMAPDQTEMVMNERELRQRLEVIERQQSAIRSMSTPIIQVWDDVLALPIIGVVDSVRATAIMETLLASIVRTRARYAIIDLTGVETVDTATADHLIKVIYAVQLLGARGIVTGIQPMVAQIMTALGVELSRIATLRNLRDAIRACMRHADAQRARAAEGPPRAPLLPAGDSEPDAG